LRARFSTIANEQPIPNLKNQHKAISLAIGKMMQIAYL